MKTKDFIQESANLTIQEDEQQMSMLKEECYHLAHNAVKLHKLLGKLPDDHMLDAWAAEYIGVSADRIKTVTEWLEYEILQSGQSDVPGFDSAIAESRFSEIVKEDSEIDRQMAQLRRDAEAGVKKSMDKQSDARVAAMRNPPKEKSFLQKVGDKQIGMVKGAWKGLTGGTSAVAEDASAATTSSPSIATVVGELGGSTKEIIKRQQSYTNQMSKGKKVKVQKA